MAPLLSLLEVKAKHQLTEASLPFLPTTTPQANPSNLTTRPSLQGAPVGGARDGRGLEPQRVASESLPKVVEIWAGPLSIPPLLPHG